MAALPAGEAGLNPASACFPAGPQPNVRLLVHVHLDSDHPELRSPSEEPGSGKGRLQSSQGRGQGSVRINPFRLVRV